MKKVEELQRERTLQLLGIGNGGTGDKPVFHTDMPLSEWIDAYIGRTEKVRSQEHGHNNQSGPDTGNDSAGCQDVAGGQGFLPDVHRLFA